MDDALAKRGHSLEELFFRERDAKLIEQRKKLEEAKKNADELAEISGIKNPEVLKKMVDLGISPAVLASLAILPLVEVAWADGTLSDKEKAEVLAGASSRGMTRGSTSYDLLEGWLKSPPAPALLDAWIHYIQGLKEVLNPKELEGLKASLLTQAKKVAQATGGLFSKVSPEEQAVLKKMEDAFKG